MENDSTYAMGHSHKVCQDYARSRPGFAVLSDGCSGSSDSDLGARFLVLAAARCFSQSGRLSDLRWVARRAQQAASFVGAGASCLDATLLCAGVESEGVLLMRAAGDGVLAVRMRSGRLRSWHIDDGGAPAYLSYLLDDERREEYHQAGYQHRRVLARCDGELISEERQSLVTEYVYEQRIDMREVQAVFLFSDGVASFADARGEAVDEMEVLSELCSIKGYKGAFVQRRMRRFLGKLCRERGWTHHDDVSMAALYCGDTERIGWP